ncbi:hypothetical protein BDR26DRAFT_848865 [Obelidium mucronatum]|nr:hypothetical protein BDR26DRAFT_848865 [Obelidium mucronatum]
MKEQIEEFVDISFMRPPLPANGILDPITLPPSIAISRNSREGNETPSDAKRNIPDDFANLRVTLKIDITIGDITVMDNVEWDINCTRNSPEMFAECTCAELGLPMEFRVAIAHQLREQIQVYHRTLLQLEHPFDDTKISDDDLWYNHFLPPHQMNFCGPTILRGVEVSQTPWSIDEKTAQKLRRKSGTTRTRGKSSLLPETSVARFWSTAVPVWKNGVKHPPVPRHTLPGAGGNASQQIAAAAILGRRRTRQDSMIESAEEEIAIENSVQVETVVGMLAQKKQEIASTWRCANCKVEAYRTSLVRAGPAGPATLCNDCGLHFSRTGQLLTGVAASKIETPKRWFPYPPVIDASESNRRDW